MNVVMCEWVSLCQWGGGGSKVSSETSHSNNILLLPQTVCFFHEWTLEWKGNSCARKHQCTPLIFHFQDLLFTNFHLLTRRHRKPPLLTALPSSKWQPSPGHSVHINKSLLPVKLLCRWTSECVLVRCGMWCAETGRWSINLSMTSSGCGRQWQKNHAAI